MEKSLAELQSDFLARGGEITKVPKRKKTAKPFDWQEDFEHYKNNTGPYDPKRIAESEARYKIELDKQKYPRQWNGKDIFGRGKAGMK